MQQKLSGDQEIMTMRPEAFAALIRSDAGKWGPVIRDNRIVPG